MRLRAWDLTIERGGRRLFSGLSFEADQGSALIVTGPNGAGKSSLLRALCGFLPIQAGGFALEGGDPERTVGEAGPLSRSCGCAQRRADGRREPRLLGGRARRRAVARGEPRGARARRPRPCDRLSGARALGRAEAAGRARPPPCRPPAALAPRRADDGARRRRAGRLRRDHASPSRRRRRHRRRDPRAARARAARASSGSARPRGLRREVDACPHPRPSPASGRGERVPFSRLREKVARRAG